jgi:hypothetical protein
LFTNLECVDDRQQTTEFQRAEGNSMRFDG